MALKEIRCGGCNRMLARAGQFDIIEIKCPRCRHMNHQRATSSLPSKEPARGHTDHSLDGRQASPR
ncbi:Com family DNA-binding transcriptional regulator [Salinicola sp. JS01]|uniref:Com family DNA-binding transcriptional regulator n=1 Tax=Salinicola sp. JS01 TaxID=3050071 RepID=UPI00255C1938|nr:Com family DNA-binding transcriptional regulator [Salinicola sp. JS01]WIX31198.1 Com family DNA-binding transcriptional regulator [Salinicola sp. JS01]